MLTPHGAEAPVYEKEGIIYRPDMVFSVPDHTTHSELAMLDQLVELKTTRKSAKYHFTDESVPETWLAYMKGGCYLRDTNQYDLIVLYIMGNYSPPFPCVYCDTFIFDEQEIADNWEIIKANKQVLDNALETGKCPEPFKHCYSWECKYCRYQLVCKSLAGEFNKEA